MKLVGCTSEDIRSWIENQFKPGMTWENIELDHMMPCASFDLTDTEQQKQCFHYTNLQPLFKHDNQSKSSKIVYDMKWKCGRWWIRKNGMYRPVGLKINLNSI